MVESKLLYNIVHGQPSDSLLEELLVHYQSIFEDYKLEFFKSRISQKDDLVILLCYSSKLLVGFKIGYRYNENTFYSWVGGVHKDYQRQGIGKTLAELQQEEVIKKGYQKLRTKSMNRFKPMIILNLKNGFDIIQS